MCPADFIPCICFQIVFSVDPAEGGLGAMVGTGVSQSYKVGTTSRIGGSWVGVLVL